VATYWEVRGEATARPGGLDWSLMINSEFQVGNQLADTAEAANWPQVLESLNPDNHLVNVNEWQRGGNAWSTVRRQAIDSPRACRVRTPKPRSMFRRDHRNDFTAHERYSSIRRDAHGRLVL
jgi:hypothetical protein